jgi:hypothetical protein
VDDDTTVEEAAEEDAAAKDAEDALLDKDQLSHDIHDTRLGREQQLPKSRST